MKKTTSTSVIIIQLAIFIAVLVGEVKCIIKAINCNWDPVGQAEILYTVSACTGIGAFVGYMDIQDK